MTDTVWIILIITVAIVLVLYIFRSHLSHFLVRASQKGIEAELETRENQITSTSKPSILGISLKRILLFGKRHRISIKSDTGNISDISLIGEESEVEVEPSSKRKKRK